MFIVHSQFPLAKSAGMSLKLCFFSLTNNKYHTLSLFHHVSEMWSVQRSENSGQSKELIWGSGWWGETCTIRKILGLILFYAV